MKLAVLVLIVSVGVLQGQEILHSAPPAVIHKVNPEYTKEALVAKLQGTVVLSAVVDIDGNPTEIKIVRQLGKGLDEKAVECLRQWRFKPATSHGDPIPMNVIIEVDFRLP
ncbi:MAG TPA: energy transducer TonB [Bryobacteraceae bacterium]|nr:energy transducer TonB [Bryobacteraceae bacterium]